MADNLSGIVSAVFKCDVQLFDQQSLADILLCVVDRSDIRRVDLSWGDIGSLIFGISILGS